MNRRTIKILGGTVVIALAGEAAQRLGAIEQCAADTISFCPPAERLLDRWLDHAPENEYEAFGGNNSGWIASGQVNSIAPSSSTNPYPYIPAGDSIIRIRSRGQRAVPSAALAVKANVLLRRRVQSR